jgi:hypothetical protein
VISDRAGLPRSHSVEMISLLLAYVVGVATVEIARSRRAPELHAHICALPPAEFPALAASPDEWVAPLPDTRIEQGLRQLIPIFADDLRPGGGH